MVFLYFLAVILGILGLVWGADRFIEGAVQLSRRFSISPLVIGLTVVSFGTSMPELITTLMANLTGHPSVAVGNVVGSNIANICLILGAAALFKPLTTSAPMMRKEYPFLIVITVVIWLMSFDGWYGRADGILLCLTLAGFLVWMIKVARDSELVRSLVKEIPGQSILTSKQIFLYLFVGLVVLTLGSRFLVWGGVGIARWLGVDELIIGLSLVAMGTSLPELAASIAGILKKEDDIAVGNIIGSNIFNTLAIIGIPSTINPLYVARNATVRDIPIMLFITLLLWPLGKPRADSSGRIGRKEAVLLLGVYAAYLVYIFMREKGSPVFS